MTKVTHQCKSSGKVKQLDMYGCMLDHSFGLLLGVAEDCAITTN